MESSDDNYNEEEENEWKTSFTDSAVGPNPAAVYGTDVNRRQTSSQRVILHFDLDCFYAQVEMIRNPALRHVPLGIQQKYIVVTCNYVAREQGVTKLMSLVDAREKCPQLVLVKGEDLSHYRDMSYKVTELLMSYCPTVERLGLDENFVDVTEMVEKRLTHCSSFEGHVYNRSGVATSAAGADHPRLAAGSHIAAELRAAIHGTLGLTGCAGVSTSKLLAKLVSGTFKPNQQTTLLPGDVDHIMVHLGGLRRVPGVGHQTNKRLQALGLATVQDLQLFPLADLVKEFGAATAQRLKNLSLGIDESPVTPTGAPQSLSDEDSFKKISTTREVAEKIEELLTSLVARMQKDGRQPQTFRLTLRRFSAENKWSCRESRQGPVPNPLGQKVVSGNADAAAHLVTMAMRLFHKMVDGGAAFHLTLLSVCFTNLLPARGPAGPGQGAITAFFTPPGSSAKNSPAPPRTDQEGRPPSRPGHGSGGSQEEGTSQSEVVTPHPVQTTATTDSNPHAWASSQTPAAPPSQDVRTLGGGTFKLPANVDPEVFRELPEDIQRELLSPAFTRTRPDPSAPALRSPLPPPHGPPDPDPAPSPRDPASQARLPSRSHGDSRPLPRGEGSPADLRSSGALPAAGPSGAVPGDVDPAVFSELPPEVQRELMAAWRQQKPVLKAPSSSSVRPDRRSASRDKKGAVRGAQQNDLYKYFKPG